MALMAPETKGFTLEEMDDLFNSGLPAWKRYEKGSRLEQLEKEIQQGNLKVGLGRVHTDTDEKTAAAQTEEV